MADPHIREAAESLLSSVTSPPYRHLTHSQSVNLMSEELVAGHRPNGTMSTVRRFFCLFVTFDLLFTGLMWLICVMMRGETLQQIFAREIIHYDIKVSLFDIVLVAIARFIVLLLFYALLYINNWTVIALSTGGTCAFLIAKVFVYDWPDASQPVYQVFLILISFVLAWSEAWFLDFRVLPQETQAKAILDSIVHQSNTTERTPLLNPGPHSTYAESTVKWFSPVDTPESSPRPRTHIFTQEQVLKYTKNKNLEPTIDLNTSGHHISKMASSTKVLPSTQSDEFNEEVLQKQIKEVEEAKGSDDYEARLDGIGATVAKWMKFIFNRDYAKEEFKAEWLTIDEYKSQADESMVNAWKVITLSNWTVEKRGSMKGDIVESRQTEFGKVYRFTGIVECPAKFLYQEFKDNLSRLPEWNPTILKSELIKQIDDHTDLSYQVTAGGGRGIIAPRDFIILRRTTPLDGSGAPTAAEPYAYISSGVSVAVPGYPPVRDMVRGHNKVGCWLLKPKTVTTPGGKIVETTTFQWLMCCDLKGKIPQFILDAAFATVMLDYIKHVRKFIADSKAQNRF